MIWIASSPYLSLVTGVETLPMAPRNDGAPKRENLRALQLRRFRLALPVGEAPAATSKKRSEFKVEHVRIEKPLTLFRNML